MKQRDGSRRKVYTDRFPFWVDQQRSNTHISTGPAAQVKHSFANIDRPDGEGVALPPPPIPIRPREGVPATSHRNQELARFAFY